MDKNSPGFWRQVARGTEITLNEFYQMEEGRTVFTAEYVETAQVLDGDNGVAAEFIFIKLMDVEKLVVVKIVGNDLDVRIFDEDPTFYPSNRREVVEMGGAWLFQEVNEDGDYGEEFDYTELTYVEAIQAEDEVIFEIKTHGELQALYRDHREKDRLATIVEYTAQLDEEELTEYKNVEMIALEVGKPDDPEGGLIKFFLARYVSPLDIEIYNT